MNKGQFKKGNIAWHSGTKGIKKANSGTFKKGQPSPFKGKNQTDEARRKMSLAKIGKPTWNKGKKRPPFSKEWREKMSKSHSGEKCHLWRGGISFEPYSIDWTISLRRSIRERDCHICQLCNRPQGDKALSVHHIDYNKKNCNPINLISLCLSCHSKTNTNRNYWIKLFASA